MAKSHLDSVHYLYSRWQKSRTFSLYNFSRKWFFNRVVLITSWDVVQDEQKYSHGAIAKGKEGKRYLQTENTKSTEQLIVMKGLVYSQSSKSWSGSESSGNILKIRKPWETRNVLKRWGLQPCASPCEPLCQIGLIYHTWEMKRRTDLEFSAGMICRNLYFLRWKFCLKILNIFPLRG